MLIKYMFVLFKSFQIVNFAHEIRDLCVESNFIHKLDKKIL